jgi:hypothetical protein
MIKINKYLYWAPRILAILLILFMMLFSLDVFQSGLTGWQIAIGLFMHNLPSLILAIVLLISWKYEIVGGIVFVLASILYVVLYTVGSSHEPWYIALSASSTLGVPGFLIGIMFLVGWFKKKK